jgi:hypothetical protein
LDPANSRRVKQSIRAWKTDVPGEQEHIPKGTITPVGQAVLIEPFEEIHVLRWTSVYGEDMALISWRDALYLVDEEDLQDRTMRVFR